MLNRFIEQLSKELNWEQPIPLQDGSYTLLFEPTLQISLRENPDFGITFTSFLAPVPKENLSEFFLKLMRANLLGKETGGGVLGLDKEGKHLLFLYFFLGEMNYKNFRVAFEDFINYAESWKDESMQFTKSSVSE